MNQDIFHILEIVATLLTVVGAIFMSLNKKEETNKLYIAFILFGISNLIFFILFIEKGVLAVAIQMIFFTVTSLNGILRISKNKQRDIKVILWILIPYIISSNIYFYFNKPGEVTFGFVPIEAFASLLAITGSFVLSAKDKFKRSFAFILFLIADILLAYIGYNHQMYPFMVQSIFFIGTSFLGYYNTIGKEYIERLKEKKR